MAGRTRSQSHQDLLAWRMAIDLVVECYAIADRFPSTERYGLADQVRRAATSIPANIAEGHGRGSDAELARFLKIARGSLMELTTHMVVAGRVRHVDSATLARILAQSDEVARVLNGLLRHVSKTAVRRVYR